MDCWPFLFFVFLLWAFGFFTLALFGSWLSLDLAFSSLLSAVVKSAVSFLNFGSSCCCCCNCGFAAFWLYGSWETRRRPYSKEVEVLAVGNAAKIATSKYELFQIAGDMEVSRLDQVANRPTRTRPESNKDCTKETLCSIGHDVCTERLRIACAKRKLHKVKQIPCEMDVDKYESVHSKIANSMQIASKQCCKQSHAKCTLTSTKRYKTLQIAFEIYVDINKYKMLQIACEILHIAKRMGNTTSKDCK